MNTQSAQTQYEEKLADRFVSCYFPSYLGSRKRIEQKNVKIPEFKYLDAQTGDGLVIELTTLTEDDKVIESIKKARSFAESDLDETKLKRQLLEEAREANSKFEGYEGSRRILLIDITFCIGRNLARFSVWYAPDQQLNMQIKETCPRVDSIWLCKTVQAELGTGEPIPVHGYQAGIERGRIASKGKAGLPQYQETGYWDFSQIYQRSEIQSL